MNPHPITTMILCIYLFIYLFIYLLKNLHRIYYHLLDLIMPMYYVAVSKEIVRRCLNILNCYWISLIAITNLWSYLSGLSYFKYYFFFYLFFYLLSLFLSFISFLSLFYLFAYLEFICNRYNQLHKQKSSSEKGVLQHTYFTISFTMIIWELNISNWY